ncbi:spindle pole body interacting protein [Trichodelitschia bisporula]|uniref:Spindle pole body interacting protein n=1 Tax=Trichodelitschia bisporula TaxID=703511 RepID=A0A6G1HUP0_9PEZI|nr:spindle pole body interacting protein [Trichodelitschia bisporula]
MASLAHRPAGQLARSSSTASNRSRSNSIPYNRQAPASQSATNLPQNLPQEAAYSSQQQSAHSSLDSQKQQAAAEQQTVTEYQGPVLRSQYPADSPENHVEYILVASFDIDRGSVMEHQYPGPISGDENMLAELMLPDQAHMRNQDWTIFFLHKDTTAEDEAREERNQRRRRRRRRKELEESGATGQIQDDVVDDDGDDESEESDDDAEGPPLIYVLNLVNTKQDQSVKRGAIVKAMAICTRHSFLHIYKPLLLLALEEYFRAPMVEKLASLYNAVNSMDLSLMPRLTPLERHILQASDTKDMFVEKFSLMIQQRMAEDAQRLSQGSQSSTSATTKYQVPRDTHEFESRVMYNGIPVPIKVPVAVTPETVGDFSLIKLISTFSTPHSTSPQAFTLHPHLTTSGPMTHPIIVLINALLTQKRVIFLGHNQPSGSVAEAVLAACALASGGILKGFTRHAFPYTDLTKIDDLLKVPGFIAGVTNPAFSHKPEWWDLLCDLPTGRMKISPKIEQAPITDGMTFFQQGGPGASAASKDSSLNGGHTSSANQNDPTGDNAFMESIVSSITNRHGEAVIRTKIRAWVHRFTLIAATFEEIVYGASALHIGASETDADAYGYGVVGHGLVWPDEASRMRDIQAQVGRIEGWRQSRSYFSLIGDLARAWERGDALRGIDLGYHIERLKTLRVGDAAAADVYLAMSRAVERAGLDPDSAEWEDGADEPGPGPGASGLEVRTHEIRVARREKARYDVINQLLVALPESSGGLFYLSLGLFHKDTVVRMAVVRLLERIMVHEAGRHFWASLGRFAKLAFFRIKRDAEGGA